MTATEMVDTTEIAERVERRLELLGAPEAQPENWKIDGRETADWAARMRAKRLGQLAEVKGDAARQRAEIMEAIAPYLFPIDMFEKEETERLSGDIRHWEAKLAEYHRDQLAEDDHLKTITLPHAKLHSRKQPDKWEFADETFIAWAREELPMAVRTKEEVDKPSVKKALKDLERIEGGALLRPDGEVVPGLVVLPGDTTFTVEQEVAL